MRKLLSLSLCLVMLFSIAIPAFAADNSLNVTVCNDLHYNMKYSNADSYGKHNALSEDYQHIQSTGRLLYESYAIIEKFFDDAAKNDSDVILLPGDLADSGTKEEHEFFANMLSKFEDETNKQVYVVPGNHDYWKTSTEEFKSYYADFGYNEAICVDELSASYTAELDDEYRLLAIDSCIEDTYGANGHGITQARFDWIKQQCVEAKEDGKKVIAMMHHNLIDHYVVGSLIDTGASVDFNFGIADLFAEYGVKYTFTGHIHVNDISAYTAGNGAIVYDVVTSSINVWPCEYRTVNFGDKVEIKSQKIENVDVDLFPDGLNEKTKALAKNDFIQYARECLEVGQRILFTSYTSPAQLKQMLKLDPVEDAEMVQIFDKVANKLSEALYMPLYKADETEEGKSIESIVTKYDKTLPASDYKDMYDLVVEIYLAYQGGNENYPAYSDELIIATRGLAAVLSYTLGDVSEEEYAQVIAFILKKFNLDIDMDILNYAGDAIKRFEGFELIFTYALNAIMVEFTVDKAPDDINATLPGYDKLVEDEKTLWEKFADFFKKIFDFIRSLFAFKF